jgi:hypothetical protein
MSVPFAESQPTSKAKPGPVTLHYGGRGEGYEARCGAVIGRGSSPGSALDDLARRLFKLARA